ncbi:MAG: EF-hand domain-containing protein, partial [Ramlibacter sp.]
SPNATNLASPGTPAGTPVPGQPGGDTSAVIQPGATTMGAAGGAPGPAQSVPSGPSPYSAQQLAEAFRAADANLNGELTRAEAQRLSIMPSSFEEMDRNKDGILSRSEFEDGVR